jgi:hypothetical protein
VRRRNPNQVDDAPDKRQPVSNAHIDQTRKSAIARVHRHVPEAASELLNRRFQIINLWRPIDNPAVDWPLALCDFRTVDAENDVVPVALIYPDREGETYGVKHNPAQKWKYFHSVTPEEAILIKWSVLTNPDVCHADQDNEVLIQRQMLHYSHLTQGSRMLLLLLKRREGSP